MSGRWSVKKSSQALPPSPHPSFFLRFRFYSCSFPISTICEPETGVWSSLFTARDGPDQNPLTKITVVNGTRYLFDIPRLNSSWMREVVRLFSHNGKSIPLVRRRSFVSSRRGFLFPRRLTTKLLVTIMFWLLKMSGSWLRQSICSKGALTLTHSEITVQRRGHLLARK